VQVVIALVATPEGLPLTYEVLPGVQVKLLPQDGEFYVLAQSRDRVAKEWALRQRQLKWLWARLKQLAGMDLTREASSRLPFTLSSSEIWADGSSIWRISVEAVILAIWP
jgi:hypothetical protein